VVLLVASIKETVGLAILLPVGSVAAARDLGQIFPNSDPKISAWFRRTKSQGDETAIGE
jgi:hypothetical protein